MRKVLSLTFGVGVVLLLLFLLLGCGGGRGAPTAIGTSVSSSQTPDLPQGAGNFVGVPYLPDGSINTDLERQIAVVSSGTPTDTVVTISAEGVTDLANFTYELKYDPDLYNPVSVEYGELMPAGDDLITFSYLDERGVVSIAEVFVHPDEAAGVSGSGALATVTFENRPYAGKTVAALPGGGTPVTDFVEDPDAAPDLGVMWTTSFFRADCNQDSAVTILDITPLAAHFGESVAEVPVAAVVDNNADGAVTILDMTLLSANFTATVQAFEVRVAFAEDAVDEDYTPDGDPIAWNDQTTVLGSGFKDFHYILVGDYSAYSDIWVKVAYTDGTAWSDLSDPPVHFQLEVTTPPISIVPGTGFGAIEIQIENTTNTTGGDRDGTDLYAPVQGIHDTGDATANDAVTLRLTGVHYLYQGNPYGIGETDLYPDPVLYPDFNGQTGYNAIIAVLQELLVADDATVFQSGEGDPEAFEEEVPKQSGDRAYTGTIGPNAPSAVAGATIVTANAFVTPPVSMTNDIEQTFFAVVDLNVVEDGLAPEVFPGFSPSEMAVNKEGILMLGIDFGWDDWDPEDNPLGTAAEGEEYTTVPTAIQLINTAEDPWVVIEFAAAEDPNPPGAPETPDPPTVPLTYTYTVVPTPRPGEPEDGLAMATMFLQAYLPTGQTKGDYVWRVIETEQRGEPVADVQIRSSRKQPGEHFTIKGAEFLNVVTFPMNNIYPSEPSAIMYFLPADPMVRLKPTGHAEEAPGGTIWVADDEAKYDIVKRDGAEFVPQPFDMVNVLPESPSGYYVMGSTPPANPESGTHLGSMDLQPHCVGINVAPIQVETLPGDVSIALFDREGYWIAHVTKNFIAAPGPGYRDVPVIDETTDFGVEVWDAGGVPDFSNKTAHKGTLDIVVFELKNVWIRHKSADDGSAAAYTASHLILQLQPAGAELPPIQVTPRVVSESLAVPCLVSIDPTEVYYWHDSNAHALNNGNWEVWFENAGAGRSFQSYQEGGEEPGVWLTISP